MAKILSAHTNSSRHVSLKLGIGLIFVMCLALGILLSPGALLASTPDDGELSFTRDQMASFAAAKAGTPVSTLKAISLTEAGQPLQIAAPVPITPPVNTPAPPSRQIMNRTDNPPLLWAARGGSVIGSLTPLCGVSGARSLLARPAYSG